MLGLHRWALAAAAALGMSQAAEAAMVSVDASVIGNPADIVNTITLDVNPDTGQAVDGDGVPIPLSEMPFVTYGSFVMSAGNDLSATETVIGDGRNDQVRWVFDFSGDPDVGAFEASADPLISGVLTLTLLPQKEPPYSERTFIPGIGGSYAVEVTGAIDEPLEVTIQLVQPEMVATGDAHPAHRILEEYFDSGSFGPQSVLSFGDRQLPFQYIANAFVLEATLELTRGSIDDVPAPATLALFGVALAGLGAARRQRKPMPR